MPAAAPADVENFAVVDEQHVRIDVDGRIALGEFAHRQPVCGGALTVEQSGGREHECAAADRGYSRTAARRRAYRVEHRFADRRRRILDTGHDHRIGAADVSETPRHVQVEQSGFDDRRLTAHSNLIRAATVHSNARKAVAGEREVERDDAVQSQNGDDMHG